MVSLFSVTYTHIHTNIGGASVTELPACSAAGTLQWERGTVCHPRGRVKGVGAGERGVRRQNGRSEAGPRKDDGVATASGGGVGGAGGKALSTEEQQSQPGGPASRAGGQVQTLTDLKTRNLHFEDLWHIFHVWKDFSPKIKYAQKHLDLWKTHIIFCWR